MNSNYQGWKSLALKFSLDTPGWCCLLIHFDTKKAPAFKFKYSFIIEFLL